MFLLDTCAISDFVKGHSNTLGKLKSYSPSLISISAITLMEIEYGLKRIPTTRHKFDSILNPLFECIDIHPFGQQIANCAAEIRYELIRIGSPIGVYDFLIAATALEKNLILVTSNTREFARVKELHTEDWRLD